MTTDLTVFPIRFSSDPAAMRRFLETLGMAPLVTSGNDAYADMVAGGGGRVMVHVSDGSATGAPAGETQLCVVAPSTEEAAAGLRAAGLEVVVWDESYGRQGAITGPHGEAIGLNEDQADTYGYVAHDGAGADPRLSVAAIRPSAPGTEREADLAFFGALGFEPVGEGDEVWQGLSRPGGGSIGLHAPGPGERPSRSLGEPGTERPAALARLGFETTEDLAALAARLRAAGYEATAVLDSPAPSVQLRDPDGQHMEIHPRPAA